ncbi:MAG TPA: sulfotransferase [Mycobacteriales bacterium]|nr:sulfotransferase [Mycobacteriales bacterium]
MSPSGAQAGRLPNFVVIGAQKAGTSTLHRILQAHPEAFMCDPKEPHFFSDDQQWARGGEWYQSLFAAAGDAVAVGEASTTYAMYPHYGAAVARLTSLLTEPRLVYIVRDPMARMRSAYLHGLAGGTETRPIDVAIRADPRYLLTSCYALQLERWLARVPRERILLLSLEQLRDDPDTTLARLFGFLDLTPTWRPSAVPAANPSEGKQAPRRWWRTLGEATLRLDKTDWVPEWMIRLNESRSPVVRREVAPDELSVSDRTAAELARALHADQVRLREHWGPEPTPDWLENDFLSIG